MNIIEVSDEFKQQWDGFVAKYAPDGGLLQRWAWGDLQKSLDFHIRRLAAIDGEGNIQACALLIRNDLQFEWNYLYSPRGPVFGSINKDDKAKFLKEIENIAREEKSFMVRLDPAWLTGEEQLLINHRYRKSEYETQPRSNFRINLSSSEDQLLAAMKQKTRYNISLAEKKGVTVTTGTELSDIEAFWELMKQTAKRGGFSPHTKEHYKKMYEKLQLEGAIKLYLASFDQKVIAAMIIGYSGDSATYLHGASADMYREVMAPYLLQWQAVKDAKANGCQWYDFGGVNSEQYQNKNWEGISRFKLGFSEKQPIVSYIGLYERINQPFIYSVYKFVKQIRG